MTTFCHRFAALATGLALLAGAAAAGENMPVYKLSVGQKLVYSESREEKAEPTDTGVKFSTVWNLVVASEDKTVGWRLIGQRATWQSDTSEEKQTRLLDDSALVSFQLSPRGHITWNGTLHFGLDPCELFPLLPTDAAAREGWNQFDPATDTTHDYRLAAESDPAAGTLTFRETRSNPLSLVVGRDRASEFFDVSRGLIAASEESDPSDPHSAVIVTKLESVTAVEEDSIARLISDYDRYVAADQQVGPLHERAQKDPQATLKLWGEAEEEILTQARAATTTPMIQETLDRQIARHSRNPGAVLARAKNYAELLRQPPVEWEALDLEGNKHSLAQYRGKVVVLDFWYRGCGWCILAMPQIKQVATHFAGKQVVVLGMNVDTKVADANFVVDKLKLGYPNLRAEEIPQQYKVHGYPVVVVIDTEGKVHDVHFGYSRTLKDDLIRSIEGSLP